MTGGEGFLGRWSRRKREGEGAPAEAPVDAVETPPSEEPKVEVEDGVPLVSLPDLEELSSSSDLSDFMRAGVPDGLRQRAIKRMWSLDPAIRDFVGLADYAYDYNAPDGVPGFGPMRVGDDLAALLRQAIGAPEPITEEEVGPQEGTARGEQGDADRDEGGTGGDVVAAPGDEAVAEGDAANVAVARGDEGEPDAAAPVLAGLPAPESGSFNPRPFDPMSVASSPTDPSPAPAVYGHADLGAPAPPPGGLRRRHGGAAPR